MGHNSKKKRTRRPQGRFDFDRIEWKVIDDENIEFTVKIPPKYEPIVGANGEPAYKDKFSGDVYPQRMIIDLIRQLFSKENVNLYNTPAKISDYCSFLRERKLELIEHWDEPYELESADSKIDQFLETHKGKNVRIVSLVADLEGSTKLSFELDRATYEKIIKIFVLEMSLVVDNFNGLVFKTGGDSIIGVFPADTNFTSMCDLAVQAAMIMRAVVEDVINPIFIEKELPEIGYHIGLEIGSGTVGTHGARGVAAFNEIISPEMNLAAKISSLAGHNEIYLGRRLFEVLYYRLQQSCREVDLNQKDWSLVDPVEGKMYQIYSFLEKWPCNPQPED